MTRRAPDSIWLRAEPRGRQPGLSRSAIAAAALALADSEGFENVSMRRLASALGTGTMTLYHYVRTKDDLLALMDDALMAMVILPALPKGWRAGMRAIATRTRDVFRAHVWALVSMRLAPPGPHAMLHFEQCLVALAEAPLSARGKLALLASVDDFVFGSALRSAPRRKGEPTEAESRAAYRALGEREMTSGLFPRTVGFFAEAGEAVLDLDDERRFTEGVDAILAAAGRDPRDRPL